MTTNNETGGGPIHALKRMLLPAAASAASAVTAYLVRKAVPLVREKIEEMNENGTLAKTKDAVAGPVSGAVSSVSERLGGGDGDGDAPSQPAGRTASSGPSANRSSKEMEQRRRARAQERQERQKALRS